MRNLAIACIAFPILVLCACAGSSGSNGRVEEGGTDQATSYEMDGGKRRVNDNQGSGPLGSQTNPVKCDGFDGAKAYLEKLRGPNGEKISYVDAGSAGVGPFGSLIYQYDITIPTPGGSRQTQIFVDIDFADYSEGKAATGFTIK